MTDLTEQWQKGELPRGWYYIKDVDGDIYVAQNEIYYDYQNDKSFTTFWNAQEDVAEVLAPVPTYHEYLALQSDSLAKNEGAEIVAELEKRLKKTQGLELDLRRKNHELKELLKECKEYVKKDYGDYLTYSQSAIYQEINQALGEDK